MSWKYRDDEKSLLASGMSGDTDMGVETVITTNVITAAENGKTFFLSLAGGFVSTLPAPQAGLRFHFVVAIAPTTAYTVVCASAGTLIKGHVVTSAVALADSGTAGEGTLTFVAASAVAGDRATLICDGTNWYVQATCSIAASITLS